MNKWRGVVAALVGVLLMTGCTLSRPIHYKIDSSYGVNDPQFARDIGELLGPPMVPGNRITTYINGDEIFPAMLEAIRHAKRTIDLETYIYWDGEVGRAFTEALAERARAGVKVKVLIDSFGALRLSHSYSSEMQKAGVEVHRFHAFHPYDIYSFAQMNHRTHRKLMVIDGTIGFTGGVGLADLWSGHAQDPKHWRDNHYRLDGPGVAQIQAAFADNWMQTTGVVLEGDAYFPALKPAGDVATQMFKSSPNGGAESMQLLMLMFLAHAQKHVLIESAYFVPDGLVREALEKAAKRGVEVEIIVPGPHIDKQFVRLASRANWGHMLQAGVKIYEYQPTMIHCKMLVVDGMWVSVGSSNMDARSFRLNDEANLNVHDAAFASREAAIFEQDKGNSRLITYDEWRRRPFSWRFFDRFFSTLDLEL